MARHPAQCLICGTVDEKMARPFACEKCADPAKITLFCSRCRRKSQFDLADFDKIQALVPTELPRRTGIIVKVSSCGSPGCRDVKGSTVAVYLARDGLAN